MDGKSVLLVDDDDTVRFIFSETLRRVGVKVTEADCAFHALEQLAGGIHVDAVITDFSMPGMNGIQLAEVLDGRYPLLLVSTDNLEDQANKSSTIVQFKRKPLTQAELLESVQELFAISDPM